MHETACYLRPGDRSQRAAVDPGPAPRTRRHGYLPELVPDWSETLAFDLTVNATDSEGIASTPIYGPFRIDEITIRSGTAGTNSQQVRFVVGNETPSPNALAGARSGYPSRLATDSSRTIATLFATAVYERHLVTQTFREDISRIAMIVNNTTGAPIAVMAHVTITHLRPASDPHPIDAA